MITFQDIFQKALQRINLQLDANPTAAELAMITQALAELNQSTYPRLLNVFDFSEQASEHLIGYSFAGLGGVAQLLVVEGQVISRRKWSWDEPTESIALLNGFRINSGQSAELYYLKK